MPPSAPAVAFGPRGDTDLAAPGVGAFRRARLPASAPETRHVMGKMYLAAFLSGRLLPGIGGAV